MPKHLTLSKIFLFAMITFMVGIFLSNLIDFNKSDLNILLVICLFVFAIALIWHKYFIVKFIAIFSIVFILGVTYYGMFRNLTIPNNMPYNQDITFTGIVADEPQIQDTNYKLIFKIISVENHRYQNIINQKVLVTMPRYPEYKYGDELVVTGNLRKPEKIEEFDYGQYLSRYMIFAIIIHPTDVVYIKSNQGNRLYNVLFAIKDKFQNTINKILPEPLSALLSGLLLGTRQGIPEELMNVFNIDGITHIIAISGYNITIIVKIFERFSRSWSRKISFYSGIIGIILFTILTGASASVVRAAIISSMFLFAKQIGRRGTIYVAVVFTAFIMILQNPFILRFDIGFQLSFLAVIGLIFISPIFEKIFAKMPILFREPLSATLGAQFTTLPIIIMYFGRLSIIAPIANVLILPIIPVTMGIGFIAGLSGIMWLQLGRVIAWIAWIFLKYIIVVSQLLASVPYACVELQINKWPFILITYLVVFIIVRIMYKKFKISRSELSNY
jgi:competence protein ComEC